MTEARLNLIGPQRTVPANFEGMSIAEAAREWFLAGWQIHPATPKGVKVETAFTRPPKSELELVSAFRRIEGQNPGIRLGVTLPDDVIVIRVPPLTVTLGEGRFQRTHTTDWRESLANLRAAFDPSTVLANCPCHRVSGRQDVYLWLSLPAWASRPDYISVAGPEGSWVLLGEAFVHVPPAGSGSDGTRAAWMHPPRRGGWPIPACPDDLWTAIASRVADATDDEDCGM